ncbi:ERF family protein (plasmid) [Arsenophonus nasoniae]|uniref:ERF family protein n=1 Tax=Arsenophonus nasoniae TaxID=638 RepID=UPI002469A0E6|nr:ERF family protein [Arsenophonus nasoniae]WGM18527.1 ERF family protein [Arsenophonus nasoniae]
MQSSNKEFYQKIMQIQRDLNAPKNEWNNHSKYRYRTCEGILEAAKPLLAKQKLNIKIDDVITNIGNRYYVKSTVTLTDGQFEISATSLAREAEQRKGFDDAQLTGATISYARKYALNGLFAIDDSKDIDSTENHESNLNDEDEILKNFTELAMKTKTYDELKSFFRDAFKKLTGEHQKKAKQVYDIRKEELEGAN